MSPLSRDVKITKEWAIGEEGNNVESKNLLEGVMCLYSSFDEGRWRRSSRKIQLDV